MLLQLTLEVDQVLQHLVQVVPDAERRGRERDQTLEVGRVAVRQGKGHGFGVLQQVDEKLRAVGVGLDVDLLQQVLLGVVVQEYQVEQLHEVLVDVLLEGLLQLAIDETVELGLQLADGVVKVTPLLDAGQLSDEVIVPVVIDQNDVFQQLVFFLDALELVHYHDVQTL